MGIVRSAQLAFTAAAANNIAQSQSPGAGTITLNGSLVSGGVATLDAARRVIVTSGGNDTGITFTVIGTGRAPGGGGSGPALSETITGASGAAAATTQDFKTVSSVTHTGTVAGTVTVGTSGIGSSAWFNIDTNAVPVNVLAAVVVSGTINYSVEFTLDDPNALASGTFPTALTTSTIMPAAIVAATSNQSGLISSPVWGIRLTQNSFTNPGTATLSWNQAGPFH